MSDEMVLSARLELKDNMTATVGKTEKSLKGMERSASSAGSAVEAMAGRGNSALQSLAGGANSVDQSLSKLSRPHDVIISARDMATPAISSVERQVGGLDKSVLVNVDVDVSGADEVSALSGELDSLSDASVSAAADTEDSTDKIKASGGSIRETFSAGAAAVGGYMMSIGQRIKAGAAAGKEGLATLSNGMNTVKSAGSGLMMMGLGGFGIAEMAGSAINAGHNLYMMATRMHIAAGEAAQLSRVTSMAGVDTSTFMRSMMRLDGQATKPIKVDKYGVPQMSAAQAMMTKYGVSLTDAEGKLKPMNEQLAELSKGYKAASAAGEDEEFVMNTLGARGMAMIPVLENLSEYKGIAGGVQGIGLDPQQAEETWREMQKLKLQAGQIGLVMANAFMPLAKDIFPLLNEQFKGVAKFFSDHKEATSAAARIATYGLELMAAAKAAQLLFGVLKAGGGLLSTPFKILSAITGGGKVASTAAGAAASSLARDMVVNARTVVVNGTVGTGAAGAARTAESAAGAAGTAGAAGAAGASKLGRFTKVLGKAAMPLALAAGAYDLYSAKDGTRAAVGGDIAGSLAGGIAGAKAGAAGGAAIGAAFGGVGAAPGAAIGGAVGMVGGTLAGGKIGKQLGAAIGDIDFAGKWAGIKAEASNTWQWIANGASAAMQSVSNAMSGAADWTNANVWQPISNTAVGALNFIVGAGATLWELIEPYWSEAASWIDSNVWQPIANTAEWAWNGVSQTASDAWNWIQTTWAEATDWFDSSIWQPIANTAEWAWSGISGAADEAWAAIEGLWAEASSWFDSTVWEPISAAASSATDAIESAFSGALSYVEGIWDGLAGWFESNVWGPIKNNIQWVSDQYDALKAKGAGITGLGSGGGDSDGTPPGEWTGTTSFVPAYAAGGVASFAAANVAHGLAQINEHGGELVDLPTGSRIYPAATTARIIQRELDSGGSQAPVGINITGNTFVVREEADIDKIAHQIAQMFQQVNNNYGGAMA